MARLPRRACDGAPSRRGGVRRRTAPRSGRLEATRAHAARVGGAGRARRRRRDPSEQRQVHQRTSRSATSEKQAAQGAGDRAGDRRGSTRSRSRGRAGTSASSSPSAPRSGDVVVRLARRGRRAGRVHARAGRPRDRLGRAGRDRGPQRLGQDDAAARAARAAPARRRASAGSGRASSSARWTRRAARSPASEPLLDAFIAATGLAVADARSLLAKFGLGADHVMRRAGHALTRRTHPRGARAVRGAGRELPRARRADQPPRPAGDRAARAGARRSTTARCWS